MNQSVKWVISGMSFLTSLLVLFGFFFNQDEEEKRQGLTDLYDVTQNGMIAFVSYEDGRPQIYLQHETIEFDNPVVQLSTEEQITDLDFSPNGQILAYSSTHRKRTQPLESELHYVQVNTGEEVSKHLVKGLITEVEFDPKEPDRIFYLRASTLENYSPIASAQPHEYEICSFNLSTQQSVQHTNWKQYQLQSLNVSTKENVVYVQMADNRNVSTAEDIFEMKERIFKVPLEKPDQFTAIVTGTKEDIYDFVYDDGSETLIYQRSNGTNRKGYFEYELFQFDSREQREKQLTIFKKSSFRPILANDHELYFMVDHRFPSEKQEFQLYKMDLNEKTSLEIQLDEKTMKNLIKK